MTRLLPALAFHEDETSWSWAARLAAFHIRGPVETFLRDLGLDPFAFSMGERDEVARLCAIAGQDPQPVLRNTLTHHIRQVHKLGAEFLADSLCRPDTLRFCPACLAGDDAEAARLGQHISIHRRERLIWRLKPFRGCAVHGITLLSRARPDGGEARGVFDDSVPETDARLEMLVRRAGHLAASPLQGYAIGRIAGHGGPAWLDGQPLELAIRSTELLGATLCFGPHTFLDDLSDRERVSAATAGWDHTSQGESGIRHAFHILRDQAGPAPMTPRRIADTFGILLSDSHNYADSAPLARLLRDHIADLAMSG